MKYFIDTEFHERKILDVDTIELISVGVVCEDGREFYAISSEFDLVAATNNDWLKENVLKNLDDWGSWQLKKEIKDKIIAFIPPESNPVFYGFYCDYDWVVFCWLFGRMIDLPKGYPMYCRDLKQMFDETYPTEHDKIKQHPDYPKQSDEHNALADAKWNYELYKFLVNN